MNERDLGDFARSLRQRTGIGLDFRVHRLNERGGSLVVPHAVSEREWVTKYAPDAEVIHDGK